MKVFISWSGTLSKEIGEAFRDWLPSVLQLIKPYFTPSDIEKGSRWGNEIAKELSDSKVGIFLLTKDNLESQWMMYEAGAISKTIDSSHVCPILFGLDNSDVKGPLVQFQTSVFGKIEIKKLLKTINLSLENQKLEDKVLDEVFEMWWPKLDGKIQLILNEYKVKNESTRDDRELIEEILQLSRLIAKRSVAPKGSNPIKYDIKKFEELVLAFLNGTNAVFDYDWQHTKSCLTDETIQYFISEKGDFLNPKVSDEGNDWGNRVGYLNAYRELKSFMLLNDIIDEPPF